MKNVVRVQSSLKYTAILFGLATLLTLPACDRSLDLVPAESITSQDNPNTTQTTTGGQLIAASVENVSFQNAKGITLNAKLFLPARQSGESVPAVVIMHGCGGMWYKDSVQLDSIKASLHEWSALLRNQNIATLFVDSFTPRNEKEFCDKTPPQDAKLSPAYERTYDAYAALAYLRTRSEIVSNRIGALGLSHGGSTVLSALVNTDLVTRSQWKVWSDGTSYIVPGPVARPAQGGFKTAVAYYPGGNLFSYYGSLTNYKDGKYINYAPLLILAAEKDKLTAGTQVQYDRAVYNGAGTSIQMEIYANANHSFDEAKSAANGADWTAKQAARQRVITWLQTTL
ncbi:dienelactone hydrolase family protein [Nibrella saemangeumensis]|uniref:Dienelactone hydrolase family protein n=1 Tax=Nibrella saemangeumensis TaxID=1084526 RepID=A0ABP8NC07_9BACT